MKKLKYIGGHQPKNMVIEAEEKDIKGLIESGDYILLEIVKPIIIKKENSNDVSIRFKK